MKTVVHIVHVWPECLDVFMSRYTNVYCKIFIKTIVQSKSK